jgi:hypothetical protein
MGDVGRGKAEGVRHKGKGVRREEETEKRKWKIVKSEE